MDRNQDGHPDPENLAILLTSILGCIGTGSMFPLSLKSGLVPKNKFNILKTAKTINGCRQFVNTSGSLSSITMSLLLSFLLMIPLISCQHPQQNVHRNTENSSRPKTFSIPQWYANLPKVDGCRINYGYSGIYLDANRQKEDLLKNSAENMAKNEKVFIEVGWAGAQTHVQGLTASYILEKGWQDRASVLEKKLKIVREYRMENGIIALCAYCPDESLLQGLIDQVDGSLVNINSDDPPEWVKEPISHPGYVYGIGIAPSQIKPGSAWEEAERQARAALAFNLAVHHKVLLKTISESTNAMSQKLSETKAEIVLIDVTIIRHGYSHANQSFYALAQMPTPAGRDRTGN